MTRSHDILSIKDLRGQQKLSKLRLLEKEELLRKRMQQVPGELFYSGLDRIIPNMLSGKVSHFALNAGKGLINNYFVRKAVTEGGIGILKLAKPSGILKKIGAVVSAVTRRRIKSGRTQK